MCHYGCNVVSGFNLDCQWVSETSKQHNGIWKCHLSTNENPVECQRHSVAPGGCSLGFEHLCRPVCELSAAPMSDKQDYYWTLSDRRTGRLTHSTDSRSYFIGLLISPSCLYSISSLTLPFSHLFSSGRLLSLLLPWWRSTGFHLICRSQAIPSDFLLYLFLDGLLNCLWNTVFDNAQKADSTTLEDLWHLHQAKSF